VERDWHGLQRRSVWYDFWWGPLHATGEHALARNTSCDRDQRGGPNQISIGECDPRLGNSDFAEHQSVECICSYRRHELFLGDSDRNVEHGGCVELIGSGLQRGFLWDTLNELIIGCLSGALRSAFTRKRERGCNQHGGFEQISVSQRGHCD
jgi:hypothetical protein